MIAKLIGLMPVRNEDWCLGLTARVALKWVDELVILDHASTDGSLRIEADIAAEHPGRVHLISDTSTTWTEMEHRQRMLECARAKGATHIAIVDADELLTGNLLGSMGRLVKRMNRGEILQLPLYNLRGSPTRYHASGIWGNRIVSVGLQDGPGVAWEGDRFHAREPLNNYRPIRPLSQNEGGVMHLWGISEERLRAKHALYKLTERVRWANKSVGEIDRLYSLAIRGEAGDQPKDWRFNLTPGAWWSPYGVLAAHLQTNVRAEPWQAREVREIIESFPDGTFAGLDLFGVA